MPPDVREMALVADGFYGGWRFAGGEWGGLEDLCPRPALDYETQLGYEERPLSKKEVRKREDGSTEDVWVKIEYPEDLGDVYVCGGAAESDNYEHVLCPPEIWTKMGEVMGEEVQEGEA
jgi:hypothetical protein